jgi:LuxR family transcriptional regulator, quorum-sensing system regulator BjaR1
MLDSLLAMAGPMLAASSAQEASRAFFRTVQPHGATYLQTRHYRVPSGALTPDSHWSAGGFIERISRPSWVGSDAFNYICFECVPTLQAPEERRTRFRFGDFAPHADRRFGQYWDAMSEAGVGEMLCSAAYGASREAATLHLGVERRDFAPGEAEALQFGGLMLTEKLMTFGGLPEPETPRARLTTRERDSLTYVAEGKTDWEIAKILGISETTARTHVDNARRKLGAVNRAHAVARLLVGS